MCQLYFHVANSPHLHQLQGVVQISTLADLHRQVSGGRLHRGAARRLLQVTIGQAETSTPTDQEACHGRGLLDDIGLDPDPFPPAPALHREDGEGGARVRGGILVLDEEGAGVTVATAVMAIGVEVEAVVMVEGADAEIMVG